VRGLDAALNGPLAVGQDLHLRGVQLFRRGRLLGFAGGLGHPSEPCLPEDLPHRGARQRGARPLKLSDDLFQAVALAAR